MKKITMQVKEFLQFRQTAEKFRIFFTYGIKSGTVTVKADRLKLAEIGY